MATFLATVQYGEKGHEVLLEVWLENDELPGVTDREEVENALRQTAASGVPPEGWRVQAIAWEHPRSAKSGAELDLSRFDALIRSSEIQIDEPGDEEEGGEE